MSITAAQDFRQHVNRMPTLQREVAAYVCHGTVDYSGLAELGRRSGFDFSAAQACQVLCDAGVELSEFERQLVSREAVAGSLQRDIAGPRR
jgi:hypothetical protein